MGLPVPSAPLEVTESIQQQEEGATAANPGGRGLKKQCILPNVLEHSDVAQ